MRTAAGVPVEPSAPVFGDLPERGGSVEVVLPMPYSVHADHAVSHFVVQYRTVLPLGGRGAWVSVIGDNDAERVPLSRVMPSTRYEVVLVAINNASRSSSSVPTLLTTPMPGKHAAF